MAEEKLVRIAVKEPYKPWEIRTVEDTLKTYQDIVGGNIEHFGNIEGANLFCNEDGVFLDLKFNIYYQSHPIFGTIFAAQSDEEGEFVSLSGDQAEHFVNLGGGSLYFRR